MLCLFNRLTAIYIAFLLHSHRLCLLGGGEGHRGCVRYTYMYKYTHGLFELDNSRVYTCVYTAYMSDLLCIPHESKTESDLSSTVELGGYGPRKAFAFMPWLSSRKWVV